MIRGMTYLLLQCDIKSGKIELKNRRQRYRFLYVFPGWKQPVLEPEDYPPKHPKDDCQDIEHHDVENQFIII